MVSYNSNTTRIINGLVMLRLIKYYSDLKLENIWPGRQHFPAGRFSPSQWSPQCLELECWESRWAWSGETPGCRTCCSSCKPLWSSSSHLPDSWKTSSCCRFSRRGQTTPHLNGLSQLEWSVLSSLALTCEVLMSLHKEGENLRDEVFLFRREVSYLLTFLFIFTELNLIDDLERLESKCRERILSEYMRLPGPGSPQYFVKMSTWTPRLRFLLIVSEEVSGWRLSPWVAEDSAELADW